MSSQPADQALNDQGPGGPAPGGQAPERMQRTKRQRPLGLSVAVTGPTGAIGRAVIRALERDDRIESVVGMARRPLDPDALGWHKTKYRQGDVTDPDTVADFVAEADVVVHLAFAIIAGRDQSLETNLAGSRNVFEAAVAANRPYRLVHASSLAAYGYHSSNPSPLTEDVPARGSDEHYYSAQKAACEAMLADITDDSGMQVYVLRPCIVVGPDSALLISNLRLEPAADMLPTPIHGLLTRLPGVHPVLPDPGVPIQLVHEDDVASAVLAAALGAGPPGPYNLAGEGEIRLSDLAHAVGDYAVPVPHALVDVASRLVKVLPFMPPEAEWVHAARQPMLMDTTRARRDLGWKPKHTAREALDTMARAAQR
jgi:UDP-glucose 4-epimerase